MMQQPRSQLPPPPQSMGGGAMQPRRSSSTGFAQPGGLSRPKSAKPPPPDFDLRSVGGLRVLAAEFTATMLLVFVINAAAVSVVRDAAKASSGIATPALLQTAAAIGMAYATLVHAFAHISGAHMNPAITVALLAARKIYVLQAFVYIIAQILGAMAGAGILDAVTGMSKYANLGATSVPTDVTSGEAFGMELILTFVLSMSLFSLLDPENDREMLFYNGGFHIGVTYAVMTLAGGSWSGAVFNPARAFGASVVSGDFANHWVYWVGPLTGGCLGGLSYAIWFDVGEPTMNLKQAFAFRKKKALGNTSV
eukprot:UC1_evm2s165